MTLIKMFNTWEEFKPVFRKAFDIQETEKSNRTEFMEISQFEH